MFGSSVNCLFCVVVYGFSGVFCLKKEKLFLLDCPSEKETGWGDFSKN